LKHNLKAKKNACGSNFVDYHRYLLCCELLFLTDHNYDVSGTKKFMGCVS